jgi:hypothetical protein
MTRRLAVALVTAVFAGLAGCTGEAAAPGTPSGTATSTTTSAVVVEPGSSTAASSPGTSSSFVVPTPSVIDVPTPTSADPWPPDLTPEQVADAQGALAGYTRYWELVDRALREPGKDWSVDISAIATADAEQQLISVLAQMTTQGLHANGELQFDPKVTAVQSGIAVIDACLDGTNRDFLDPNGQVIPDAPGTYRRHTATAQVVRAGDGTWLVASTAEDGNVAC